MKLKRWIYRASISLVISLIILFITQGNDLDAIEECGFGNISMNRSMNDPNPRCLQPNQFGSTSPDYIGSVFLFTTFIIGFFVTTALDVSLSSSKSRSDKK